MADEHDWHHPRAMAIPPKGFITEQAGRYGPMFPKTPACYGFTVIAKIKPGTEQEIREYGKTLEIAVGETPDVLAPLQLHYLRWVLFKIGGDTYFMYQGIFDTDFDKYTEDAVAHLQLDRHHDDLHETRRLSGRLEDQRAGLHQVRARPSATQLSRVRGISVRIGARDQEGVAHEGGLLRHARRIAVMQLDDIQHFLVTRTPALAARYEFLSFDDASAGKTWLAGVIDKVGTASSVGTASPDARWVTVAFTWNGLRALGVDDASLATFPEEFRQGLAARAELLGITGDGHPDHWDPALTAAEFHAIVILFARDVAERERCEHEHAKYLAKVGGVRLLGSLNLEALPPYGEPREHFGYLDRLTHPSVEGTNDAPTPGSLPAVKAGEFFLGYPDESGATPAVPEPQALTRNGSYLAYLRLQEHVGVFREFLKAQGGPTNEEQELLAAKLMGRWRSGAPLVLAPERDDPALGSDLQRTNNFNYATMDPRGYGCPVGAHIRRMNPRDTGDNLARHQIIRRGGTYGPLLPPDAADDGADRGIAAFMGCGSLVRQFEFAMNVWANDPNFRGLGNERDPIIGTQDGTLDLTIPKRPIRKKIVGLPAFTTVRGGAYLFLPGIDGLRFLARSGSPATP